MKTAVESRKKRNIYIYDGKVRLRPNGQVQHTQDGVTWTLGLGDRPPMGERDLMQYVRWRKRLPKPTNRTL